MDVLLLSAYFGVLALLALSGLHRLHLTLQAVRRNTQAYDAQKSVPPKDWPSVVIQLPMYNEAFVAERVIRAAAAQNYPLERFTVQVLDDSTDETVGVVNRVVADLQRAGRPVEIVRRPTRTGYKAGALAYGLEQTSAELVAIFDADFVPLPDFLEKLVPQLQAEPRLGLVQARWSHLNRDASLLTRAQGIFLDGHFAIEHAGRDRAGLLFNFNGTAGIWRRAAIEEAGGWRADTITEDL
ncbi:MAG: glycosyltransferase, partial [Myxococcota bacterium]